MIKNLYLYISKSTDPYENLAAEELLFDFCPKDSFVLYLWQNDKTVVIGKNQNPISECNLDAMKKDGIHLARRLTGGGAVYHDVGNLNFTFICNEKDYDLNKNFKIITSACAKAGIKAELSGRNDILTDGKKFSGNAFLVSHSKACHHGTILIGSNFDRLQNYLTPSKLKLEAKGVKSVRSRVINLQSINDTLSPDKMADYIVLSTKELFGMEFKKISHIADDDIQKKAETYRSDEFLYGSSAPFNIEFAGRFPWGEVRTKFDVKKGTIAGATLYTDAMDASLSDIFSSSLKGVRFDIQSIKNALDKKIESTVCTDIISMIKVPLE